jgi:hypothetical protein
MVRLMSAHQAPPLQSMSCAAVHAAVHELRSRISQTHVASLG